MSLWGSTTKNWEINYSNSITLIILLHALVNGANVATSTSEAAGGDFFFSFDYYDVDLFYFIYLFFGRWCTFCICNVPKIHRTNKKNKKRKGCLPRGWHGFGPNGVPWYHVVPWVCLEKLVGIFLFFSFLEIMNLWY